MSKTLVERLKHFQFDRPSEWLMKEFIQQAEELEGFVGDQEECPRCGSGSVYWKDMYRRQVQITGHLQSRIEAVRKLVDECVQYQERRFQGDFDATFYLKIPRDKLREALGGKHD